MTALSSRLPGGVRNFPATAQGTAAASPRPSRVRGSLLVFFLLFFTGGLLRAEVPPLLQEIADHWSDEHAQWGFTQLVKETDRNGEVHERLERFDLARGYEQRWELLKIDGRPPTAEEIEAWGKRKNKGKKKEAKSWLQYVDLGNAQIRGETATRIRYEVPLKRVAGGLFPGDKISVYLTIDKESRAIEHAHARIDEPFNVALGLGEVLDVKANIDLPPEHKAGTPVDPAGSPDENPSGSVSATLNKLGKRVEYTWSDFHRTLPR